MPKLSLRKTFLLVTLFGLCVRFFLIEDYRVVSNSMAPALSAGDLVFVSKSSYSIKLPFSQYEVLKFGSPKRGEVVALSTPTTESSTYIKRVVGLAGDEVVVRGGRLFLNGEPVELEKEKDPKRKVAEQKTEGWEKLAGTEPYLARYSDGKIREYGPVLIPNGHFFVLGDNRTGSIDSRKWGPIPVSYLKGRVWKVWASVDSSGSFRPKRAWLSVR